MNASKKLLDILVVIILIVLVVVFFGSRRPGPVETARDLMHRNNAEHLSPHDLNQGMPMGHPDLILDISDGDPIITSDAYSVGRDWFEYEFSIRTGNYVNSGMDEETAGMYAIEDVLMLGLRELVILSAVDEFGIEPYEDYIDTQEANFYASLESEGDAEELLRQMGMTMETVRDMWRKDYVTNSLKSRIAELNGVEPMTSAAEETFLTWLDEKIISTEWVFEEPELETLYHIVLESDGDIDDENEQVEGIED